MVRKKQVIIGGICIIGVLSVGIFATSKIKHGLVENINIESTKYEALKNNMVAMYTSEDGENYTEIEGRMPSTGYIINEEKSYCNLNGSKDTNAKLKTVDGNHIIANLIKGDKCYLYFDNIKKVDTILGKLNVNLYTPNFDETAVTNEGIFEAEDDYGTSYYYRGAVTNNWFKFGKENGKDIYWRIIRINGNGTIRIMYAGTDLTSVNDDASIITGNSTVINETMYPYNNVNANAYVGFMYEIGVHRGYANKSNALSVIEQWYNSNILNTNYEKYIDINTGFCGDRSNYSSYKGDAPTDSLGTGINSVDTWYGARIRLSTNKKPILNCPSEEDLYTIATSTNGNKKLPIPSALITADEIAFAGGVSMIMNKDFYLYSATNYWTMTPSSWVESNDYNSVFAISGLGGTGAYLWNNVPEHSGLRPVINISKDTKITGKGIITDPYSVVEN